MSSSGGAGGVSQAAYNDLAIGALQNGVVNAGDLAQSAISITTATGALAFTVASAAAAWILSSGGALAPYAVTGAAHTVTPGTLPATTKYAVIGLELTSALTFTAVKGTDTATELNTGALIAANSPAVTAGNLRVLDVSVYNNAGVYAFGDQTTTATQGVNWIDRRPSARGAYYRYDRGNAGSYTISSSTPAAIDTTNLQTRVECSGAPMRIGLPGATVGVGAAAGSVNFTLKQDGVIVNTLTHYVPASEYANPDVLFVVTPAAGSHNFEMWWANGGAGTFTLYGNLSGSGSTFSWELAETVRQSFANGGA